MKSAADVIAKWLHPDDVADVIAALDSAGYRIVRVTRQEREPWVWPEDALAARPTPDQEG